MQIAPASDHADVKVDDPAGGYEERGDPLGEHAGVEDRAGVGATLVGGEEVDDRVPADLLLPVAGKADVYRQGSFCCEQRRRLQQQVELALVIGGAACVEVAVADCGLERIALPEVERLRA